MSFEALAKAVKTPQIMVFFDLEGTQFTHKAIAIGLVARKLIPGTFLFSDDAPIEYHSYINNKDDIGPVVKEMTGITPELLAEKGKDFHAVILEISKLLRPYKKFFVSYGANDIMMLNVSANKKNQAEMNFIKNITNNYLDFHAYLGKRIVSEKGQSFSIEKLMKLYDLKEEGNPHDPLFDSKCLMDIFQAYSTNEEKDIELFLANYFHNRYVEPINAKLAKKVYTEGKAAREDLLDCIRENL